MSHVWVLQSDSGDYEGAFSSQKGAAEHAKRLIKERWVGVPPSEWMDYFVVLKVGFFA